MSQNHLILFIKAPQAGRVKTRLQPDLSPAQSEQLYKAMVEDLATRFTNADSFQLTIYFSPTVAAVAIRDWLGTELRYRPQSEGDLGERMHNAFAESLQDGYEQTIIIGSDLPTLSVELINSAFNALEDRELALGPTDDGGYYLIGQKSPDIRLFNDVHWSSETVLNTTLENARKLKLTCAQLSQLADIDTIREVRQLAAELSINPTAAPATAAALRMML